MKKLIYIIFIFFSFGCMSDREYMLRKRQLEAQASHPPTYKAIEISGEFTLGKAGRIIVNTPSQPFTAITIPNGMEYLRDMTICLGALGMGAYGIHEAGRVGGTSKTTNYYNGAGTVK